METTVFFVILGIAIVIGFIIFRKSTGIVVDDQLAVTYKQLLQTHIEYYQNLSDEHKIRFEQQVEKFVENIRIEGIGTEITDTDRVLVASSAVIPIFGFPDWEYQNLTNVIVYPDTFNNDFQFEGGSRNIMGMVGTGYMNGQMLLSRQALVKGFSKNNGKENTAIHEFVHLLDKTDGATDGVPENLMAQQYVLPWLQMMHREMHRIKENRSDINPYALTNEAEFLAVVSEYFFEKPEQFQSKHPELYEQLSMIFKQDPAGETN
ncbi:M90 family metallopeptidase [Mucilaginibacter myungsuensis]|uniref:Zinc-dependent peptidase n=1 Tax=Mucilaginibacter myungsuensis TaxID=649104 RepID=A0A929PXW9_9SPHI|nr:M90 family metallopeptidase [Mucilaginibacter myungsuensis]MBE9662840.1 zinc-dependent peptidase [Mucilaginibacter myungsuensis]MDN3598260.1 zinc-dependent peptidase [Mucilaginibacter myungsuensis]